MNHPKILIKQTKDELLKFSPREQKRGEILHFILSKINRLTDLNHLEQITTQALAYFGGRTENWDLAKEFIVPIQTVLNQPCLQTILVKPSQVFSERTILWPNQTEFEVLRPDKVILTESVACVLEFKSEYQEEYFPSQQTQLKKYMKVIAKLFPQPVRGYLIYILSNKIIEIKTTWVPSK